MSKVGVCIGSYNRADLLPETLDGLTKQTFQDFTVYLTYDGTVDNTEEVIAKYSSKIKIVGIDTPESNSEGSSKNIAVSRAIKDGVEYVQMIDSDDIPMPRMLEENVKRIERGDIDWVLCWGRTFGGNEGYIHARMPSFNEEIEKNHLHSWAMFRSSVIEKHNFRTGLKTFADYDVWLRLFKDKCRGDIVDQELYLYRVHPGNMIRTVSGSYDHHYRKVLSLNGLQKYIMNKKYRFHMLGLVHLPCSKKYMACAFTQKNHKLARMLLSLGHEVFYYGAEGSDVPCTEFIQTHSLRDICDEWGDGDNRFEIGYNYQDGEFRHDFIGDRKPVTQKFYAACIAEVTRRKKEDDFLLLTQGLYHKPVADVLKMYLSCEPGIGYRGSYCNFRAFESSYIQNFTYGSEHPYESINGHFYDRVIPNYFDAADVEYSENKQDYYFFIGRMIHRKGILTAYKTCEAIGAKLLIAGQGGVVNRYGYLHAAQSSDFELPPGNWEYVGYADVEKRKKLMAHARGVFCASEYMEPFCGTHVEAMLSGTPPICTNFGAFTDTIIQGVNGFKCDTLDDFVWSAKKAATLDPKVVRFHGERYLMDYVKWEFQKWFDDLYQVYLSTTGDIKGWHHIREKEPEWRDFLFIPRQ